MSEKSLSVNPVIEPFAGAVAGLGLGYAMAPRKYSLKRMLIMKPERLTQIYTKDVIANMKPNQQKALENILSAKKEYAVSRRQNFDEIKKTAKIWHDEFKKVDVPQNLTENYENARRTLQEAIEQEDYIKLNKKFREAKKALEKSPEDTKLKQALATANEQLAKAKTKLAAKIEVYSNTVKNIYNERLYNIKSKPAKWTKVKEAYNDFLVAIAKRRTLASNKLFELSNNKNLIKSYNAIKSFLPKARTKSALTGAVLLGGFTTLLAAYLNPSPVKA